MLKFAIVLAAAIVEETMANSQCHWYGMPCATQNDCCVDGNTPSCCMEGFCQGGSVCSHNLMNLAATTGECHWYGFPCSAHAECCVDGNTPSCCDDGAC